MQRTGAYKRVNLQLPDRLIKATLPFLVVLAAVVLLREVLGTPFRDWDAARVVPAFALAKGQPLYHTPTSGPMLDLLYGPMLAFAYLPVTLMPSPSSAVIFGKILTLSYYFLPVLWIFSRECRARKLGGSLTLYLFVCFVLVTADSSVLASSAFSNHADAPAIGLALLACGILCSEGRLKTLGSFLASGTLITLSAWTKLASAPMIPALPLFIGLVEGRRRFWKCAGCFAVSAAVVSGVFIGIFHPGPLWFNMVVNPSSHPFPGDLLLGVGKAVRELLLDCRWMITGTILYLLYQRITRSRRLSILSWFNENRWSLFMVVGVAALPSAMLARLKQGGWLNSFSFVCYFWLVGVALIYIRWLEGTPWRKLGVVFFALHVSLIQTLDAAHYCRRLPKRVAEFSTNPLNLAYRFAKTHPGQIYFPWNTLASVMADGAFYHFDYGVVDRDIGAYPVSSSHFRGYLPRHLTWVAFPPYAQDHYVMKHLPEFSSRANLPELPGWTVYAQPK